MNDINGLGWWWRFALAIGLDIADFVNPFAHVPGIGIVWDALLTIIGLFLWGPFGLAQGLELLDLTEQVDAWIPALTIAGISRLIYERR
jgi:hypothetical protein